MGNSHLCLSGSIVFRGKAAAEKGKMGAVAEKVATIDAQGKTITIFR
jgi:hypothetical protein